MSGQLHLLGAPRFVDNGAAQVLTLNKPILLLLYLAYRGDWVSRSEVAFLFRPDDDEATALKHLRQLIHRARPYTWADTLEAGAQQLLLRVSTDVQAFKAAIQEQHWETAIGLYGGPLFSGYDDSELYTYSAWLELERSNLQASYETALLNHGQALEALGKHLEASGVLGDLLQRDPLAEGVMQAYLRNTYLAGQRDKALKTYERFVEALQKELGSEPLAETQRLAEQIREALPLKPQAPSPASAPKATRPLPTLATRFIGRKKELQGIVQHLGQAECRLLTLIGMGGIGKTRLALETAQQLQNTFPDGVYFAPLAALSSADQLIPHLIQVFGLKVAAHQEQQAQLEHYLSDKKLLLILDNFEHLLGASSAVAELLQAAPGLKVLVTSRESLKLSAEWLYDLRGLRFPTRDSDPDALEHYDAVQLFVGGVRRVAPQMPMGPAEVQTIAQICQTLEGHPLGLELASSWARIMPIERIAKELGQGYNLFETDLADLPERHRNLKAILDTTWAGLSEKKRQTLARLGVFVGGCTLEAAEQVCQSHFSILLALVNESLLKRTAANRLEMHQLVRQYAEARLCEQPEVYSQTQQQHAYYFFAQLSIPTGSNFLHLAPDFENCCQGWRWLSQHHQLDPLEQALNGIDYLYNISGRYLEGQYLYQQTLGYLQAHPPSPQRNRLMAGIINGMADQSAAMGKMEQAEQQLEESRGLLASLSGVEKQLGYVLTSMARINWQKGDYPRAEHFLQSASQTIQGIGDLRQETNILHALGLVLREQGKFSEALGYYQQALELYLQVNELGNAALALNNIGALQLVLDQSLAAQTTLQRGLALVKNTPMQRAEAILTLTYAGALYAVGDYRAARQQFQQSLALAEKTQEQSVMGDSLRMLGNTHLKLGQPQKARAYLLRSLRQSWQSQAWPMLMADLLSLAQLLAQEGNLGQSLELLAQVLHHPASKSETLKEGRALLEKLNLVLPEVGELGGMVEGLLGER